MKALLLMHTECMLWKHVQFSLRCKGSRALNGSLRFCKAIGQVEHVILIIVGFL